MTITAEGTIDDPLTINEAAICDRIEPGDTIYLREGTHMVTEFANTLPAGTSIAPITITPYPGETARIDLGAFNWWFSGAYWRYENLEFFSSSGDRLSETAESNPLDVALGRWEGSGVGVNMRNVRVHDTMGVGWWGTSGGEWNGCEIWANGWYGQGDHGHGLYSQNTGDAVKVVKNCIIGPNYGFGIHVYGSSSAHLKGYRFENCILMNDRQLVGGFSPTENITFENCVFWQAIPQIGYSVNDEGADLAFNNCYVVGVDYGVQVTRIRAIDLQNNVIIGSSYIVDIPVDATAPGARTWDNNTYHGGGFLYEATLYNFAQWQTLTGFDANSTYSASDPASNVVRVFACDHAPKVAHIAVFNWEQLSTVSVNVSGLALTGGSTYRLRNAYDPLVDTSDFVYDGSGLLSVSFVGRTIVEPTGGTGALASLDARFGAWVLEAV